MGLFKKLFGTKDADWQTTPVAEDVPPPAATPGASVTAIPLMNVDVGKMVVSGQQAQDMVKQIETSMQMDIDGDGKVGDVVTPGAKTPWSMYQDAMANMPAAQQADTVSQLERLAKLHE